MRQRHAAQSLAATEEDSVYRLYYDFRAAVSSRRQGHQILAINRGEKEDMLSVDGAARPRRWRCRCCAARVVKPGSAAMEFVKAAAEDAYDRLIYPSLEREIRGGADRASASEGAITNVRPQPQAAA